MRNDEVPLKVVIIMTFRTSFYLPYYTLFLLRLLLYMICLYYLLLADYLYSN